MANPEYISNSMQINQLLGLYISSLKTPSNKSLAIKYIQTLGNEFNSKMKGTPEIDYINNLIALYQSENFKPTTQYIDSAMEINKSLWTIRQSELINTQILEHTRKENFEGASKSEIEQGLKLLIAKETLTPLLQKNVAFIKNKPEEKYLTSLIEQYAGKTE